MAKVDKYTEKAAEDYADNEAEVHGFTRKSAKWKKAVEEYLGFAEKTMSVGRNPRSAKGLGARKGDGPNKSGRAFQPSKARLTARGATLKGKALDRSRMKNPKGKKVVEVEISDYGVDHAQYFQFPGVAFSDFDFGVFGVGHSQKSALEDAIEQLHASDIDSVSKDVEKELNRELKNASDEDVVQRVIESDAPTYKYNVYYVNEQGLRYPPEEFETREEAEEEVQRIIRRAEKEGYEVSEFMQDHYEIINENWPSNRRVWIDENPEYQEYMKNAEEHELYYYVGIRAKLG